GARFCYPLSSNLYPLSPPPPPSPHASLVTARRRRRTSAAAANRARPALAGSGILVTRKPTSLPSLVGPPGLRNTAPSVTELPFHEPPRIPRKDPSNSVSSHS